MFRIDVYNNTTSLLQCVVQVGLEQAVLKHVHAHQTTHVILTLVPVCVNLDQAWTVHKVLNTAYTT